ncbi:hypothetical protein NB699_003350 [Xanthomonas sacchari]|uniref:DUF4350 domain-containing protein n=1 Tax=Xanthomonas sacchari TaxID=56458 RepID=A0AA46SVI6_9XANT|nr:DUF4350 domain-containing protein [Xanthomonas sacchari]MCW0368367.1 hypothetical protein [Xanthomonas sacchari]MCW0441784.1 hypothetical protein [Xanthomonas sacchari]UYK89258.1 DUF4350 domain-containing protein [Xanthomonas sacchari]
MNSGTRNALIFLVGLLLVSVGAAWFFGRYERAEREIVLPPRGEAAYNPLYALRQTLRADGVRAESRQRLDLEAMRLRPHDSVVLYGDPRMLGKADGDALLDWVEHGGHLVLRTPTAEVKRGDVPILEALDITVEARSPDGCLVMAVPGAAPQKVFCDGRRFHIDPDTPDNWWSGEDDDFVFARVPYGDGSVDVLSELDFLENQDDRLGKMFEGSPMEDDPVLRSGGLREAGNRLLARQVLGPNYGQGTIHLIYSAELPSLWRTLFTRGWPAWLPALLVLLAWLWSRMQRFGPLLAAPAEDRRSLLEHVRASGEHLLRYGRADLLHAAVREAFLARLRRRAPIAAALEGPAQAAAIAERLQLPVAQVEQALQPPPPNQPAALRERIRLLVQMRNQL